jgi:hypothetical protein
MSKSESINKKCFCWNGSDDNLKCCIDRSKYVQETRKKLAKRKRNKSFND